MTCSPLPSLGALALALALARCCQDYWQSDTQSYPEIADEVTAGLFRELDFDRERTNGDTFARAHAPLLGEWRHRDDHRPAAKEAVAAGDSGGDAGGVLERYLRVPRGAPALTSRRVLTAEWVRGEKLPALADADAARMVRTGSTRHPYIPKPLRIIASSQPALRGSLSY